MQNNKTDFLSALWIQTCIIIFFVTLFIDHIPDEGLHDPLEIRDLAGV